jgi:hypothetical protein
VYCANVAVEVSTAYILAEGKIDEAARPLIRQQTPQKRPKKDEKESSLFSSLARYWWLFSSYSRK